ncbi:MAG: SUMF1/EgtB/PvdO family nonheme iron enzyme [Myxococcales bacterium]|nr:formylglycine-generating enzyme family protein [Polyangiaceae bacterium]MDW8247681.1 SUMF1/EgtB/PvdO family nonheme iron enzyme [Myxococcales bacterium]
MAHASPTVTLEPAPPTSSLEQVPSRVPESPPPASSTSASTPAPPLPGPCPAGMVLAGPVCIDRFEAPNQEGEKPIVMASALEAETWCREQGKRLCTEDEWIRACGGPKGQLFPYGTSYKEGVCNDNGTWRNPSWGKLAKWPSAEAKAEVERLDQRTPSGTRPGCVSPEGVMDTTGNVAEWVRRTRTHEKNHEHVAMGCFWGKCFRPPHTPTCDYANYNHPSGWRSYEIGFRCCKDPENEVKTYEKIPPIR